MPGFLKLLLFVKSRVSIPEALNYIHVILNLYIKVSKFSMFQNVHIHGRSFSNKAHHERNQPNKTKVTLYKSLVSLRVNNIIYSWFY